uniref:Uncharacterized protein n=1 Tax=Timema cristinae TaxID=61476 RepID=A0A7R9DFT4_TIMCR|nr:unnamed protein product [Timema cristinae]
MEENHIRLICWIAAAVPPMAQVCYCSNPENANDTVSVSFRRQGKAAEWVPAKGKPGRRMNKKKILRDAQRKGKKRNRKSCSS